MNTASHDAPSAIAVPAFRFFLGFRFCLTFATQMQAVIVGWQLYTVTGNPLTLGLIGLAEVVPYVCTSLFGGYVADAIDRRKIVLFAASVFALSSICLLGITVWLFEVLAHVEYLFFGVIFSTGIARGFMAPAVSALFAQIVPRRLYLNASAWSSNLWHVAAVAGPATGGVIYGSLGVVPAYLFTIAVSFAAVVSMWCVPPHPLPFERKQESMLASISKGISFVFSNQVILGALALDLVAVLFGGVVAVLPVFASDVLQTGPEGLGYLRAAPFLGSVAMGVFLAMRSPMQNAGWNLLLSVAGFGACMICFALSTHILLCFLFLFLSGVFDSVSVVIRSTVLQLMMPDDMRGRVSAVNNIFVGTSNELGAFESGLAARLLGLVPSILFGGSVSLLAVLTTAFVAPELRKLNLKTLSEMGPR